MTTQVTDKHNLDQLDAMRDLVDQYGRELDDLKAIAETAQSNLDAKKDAATAIVKKYGVSPPNAEKSLRLSGKLYDLTVSTGQSVTVDQLRAETFASSLKARGLGRFIKKIFRIEKRFVLVDGASEFVANPPKDAPKDLAKVFASAVSIESKTPRFNWSLTKAAKKDVRSNFEKKAVKSA